MPVLNLLRAQRDVTGVVEHDLLPYAAQDEAHELVERGGKRFARRLVHIEERQASERIGGERDVLVRRRLRRIPCARDDGNHLHGCVDVCDSRIADAVAIIGNVLRHWKDDLLELDVVAPFAALAVLRKYALADELLEAVPRL